MSFNEVLEKLPALSVGERQKVVRRALELDEPLLSASDEALVEGRLAAHHQNPGTSLPLDEMKKRLRRSSSGRK